MEGSDADDPGAAGGEIITPEEEEDPGGVSDEMLGADSVAALIFEGDPRGDPWDDTVDDDMDASPGKKVEGSDADDAAAMEEAEANRFLVGVVRVVSDVVGAVVVFVVAVAAVLNRGTILSSKGTEEASSWASFSTDAADAGAAAASRPYMSIGSSSQLTLSSSPMSAKTSLSNDGDASTSTSISFFSSLLLLWCSSFRSSFLPLSLLHLPFPTLAPPSP